MEVDLADALAERPGLTKAASSNNLNTYGDSSIVGSCVTWRR